MARRLLRFTVPRAPVPCARPRVVRGHTFTPPKTEAYEQLVALFAMKAMADARPRWARGGRGPFRVTLAVYRAADRGDVDNFAKAALDGCSKAAVWSDDARVHDLRVRLHVDRVHPHLEVLVEQFAAEEP